MGIYMGQVSAERRLTILKWTSMLPTMNSRTQKREFNRRRARPKNDEEFISY